MDLLSQKRFFLTTEKFTFFKCGKCYNYLAKTWNKNNVPRCGNCKTVKDKLSDNYYLETINYARNRN